MTKIIEIGPNLKTILDKILDPISKNNLDTLVSFPLIESILQNLLNSGEKTEKSNKITRSRIIRTIEPFVSEEMYFQTFHFDPDTPFIMSVNTPNGFTKTIRLLEWRILVDFYRKLKNQKEAEIASIIEEP